MNVNACLPVTTLIAEFRPAYFIQVTKFPNLQVPESKLDVG